MVREKRLAPRDHSSAEEWTEEPLADPSAETTRQIALRLRSAIGERSLRSVAEMAGLTHPAILKILGGSVFPNVDTIVRLEESLGVDLWPRLRAANDRDQP